MCDIASQVFKAEKDFSVWKLVKKEGKQRVSQFSYKQYPDTSMSGASKLVYPKGKVVVSPAGSGIYAYTNRKVAKQQQTNNTTIIRLVVPKYTRYRKANAGYPAITADMVHVIT